MLALVLVLDFTQHISVVCDSNEVFLHLKSFNLIADYSFEVDVVFSL